MPAAKKKKVVQAKAAMQPKTAAKKPVLKPVYPEVGDKVPSFSMPATVAGKVSDKTLKGKPYILYFYPKDDTSGCTAEACGFQEALPALSKLGVNVVGVSKDTMLRHEKFAAKYCLKFSLASDEEGTACAAFGVWIEKSMYGRKYMGIERSTFLVDAKGVVRAVWRKVSVTGHVVEVKKAIAAL